MKRIHYIAIIVILLILVGILLISPFSPLNKSSFDGHKLQLTKGYSVANSTDNSMTVTNGTNTITIYVQEDFSDVKQAIKRYKSKYGEKFNITQATITLDNGKKVIKTKAEKINGTETSYKYWFTKDNKVYNMQTKYPVEGTEDVIKKMISSF